VLDLHGELTVDEDLRPLWVVVGSGMAPGRHMILNLEHVSRLDCTGIGELVALHCAVQESGGVLSLGNVPPRQKKMLEIVGLLRALNVHDGLNTEVTANESDTETRTGALVPPFDRLRLPGCQCAQHHGDFAARLN
jgi:anti-anti-sigma factor